MKQKPQARDILPIVGILIAAILTVAWIGGLIWAAASALPWSTIFS